MTKEEYRQIIATAKNSAISSAEMQHSCACCFNLDANGFCDTFGEYPPPEFIEQTNTCQDWVQDLPF